MNVHSTLMANKPPLPLSHPARHYYRAIAASVRGFIQGSPADEVARLMYPDDQVTPIVLRATSTQATTTDAAWAGPLAHTVVSEAIEDMVALSAIGKLVDLGALVVDLDRYASVIVPGRVTSAADAGSWLAEGQPFAVRQLHIIGPALKPHKLGVMVPITREMADASNIEDVVRILLQEAARLAVDAAIFSTTAGSAARSPGILNGLTPLTPSGSSLGFDACGQDLGALVHDIAVRGGGANAAFIASPKQATSIKFWAGGLIGRNDILPVASAASIPDGTVIAVEPASVAVTFVLPEFSVSSVAAVHQEDTSPVTDLLTGVPVKSMFQTDAIMIRMTIWGDWVMRAPHVSFMNAVAW
jgi:hypothetical protein